MSLSTRFAAIKKKIGGNRELTGFEFTFGASRQELNGITGMNRANTRILSELQYAIALSAELCGKYDALLDSVLSYLEDEIKNNGVMTNAACDAAEQKLLPMKDDAKSYDIILAGHAHIDMNWMWSWHETVAVTLATFRTMLKIMDEYPDFTFSQSQASVYKIVEEYEPELMEPIKKRIAEGRWEVTASQWVECDKNMPSTESMIKHIEYTKHYMKDVWGADPDSLQIEFSPDAFGHSANIPEIDAHGGVKYYYHCRALGENHTLYRWRAPSGAEILCYREQEWYNSAITPKRAQIVFDISHRTAGLKTSLIVYGVGDHGGGPTRRDVECAYEMMKWPVFPSIRFGTFREFFGIAEQVRDKVPLVEREINFTHTGCFTTQSRIKLGNKMTEKAFRDAEDLSASAKLLAGRNYRGDALETSYRNVLFTHFHDIITGSCVQDSREYAMALYSQSLALANNESLCAMRAISEATDTSMIATEKDPASQSEGAGVGYGYSYFSGKPAPETGGGLTRIFTVFNPTAVDKDENVEITVWDWPGDMRYIKMTGADGSPVEFQVISGIERYWDHRFFRLLAKVKVEALGYTTVVLSEAPFEGLYPVYTNAFAAADHPNRNAVLDNGIIRAEIDYTTGSIISLKDVKTGFEYIEKGKAGSFVLIDTERQSSDAWHIGKYQKITPVTRIVRFNTSGGNLRQSASFELTVLGSRINAEISLSKGAKHLEIKTEVDWNEVGGETVPVLAFALPLSYKAEKYCYDVPAGVVLRKPMDFDVSALNFAAAPNGDRCAALTVDSKYGYRAREDGTLISTLINSAVFPDKYPERGIHRITVNIALTGADVKTLTEYADSVNRKLAYIPASSHKGALKAQGAPFGVECEGAVVSGAEIAKDGSSLLVRAYSVSEASSLELTFDKPVKDAYAVDYLERKENAPVSVNGGEVRADIRAYGILTVKVEF